MNLSKTSSTSGISSRKRRDRSSSSESCSSEKKVLKHKKKAKISPKQKTRNTSKHKYKKRRSRSSSSDSTSEDSSTSSSSSSSSEEERKRKKVHKLKKSKKIPDKKISTCVQKKTTDEGPSNDIPLDLMGQRDAMAPMTKEEWEKRQSVVRRVYDSSTGRNRLIKGDGEVIEEIVSKDRHKEINQQATKGDGDFFQSQLRKK